MAVSDPNAAYMQYVHASGVVARWRGGAYIDLGSVWGEEFYPGIDGDDFHAYDVVNVWDYELGQSRIPVTLDAMRSAVDEHLQAELDEDES